MKKALLFIFIFCSAIGVYSQDEREYLSRGQSKAWHKEYQEAITLYDKAIAMDSNYALAYKYRAFAKNKLQDITGALTDYDKIIHIDSSKYPSAYISRAYLKMSKRDYQGTINDFVRAIKIDSMVSWVYMDMGKCKYELKDYHGAVGDFTKAIFDNPSNAKAYKERSLAKAKLKDIAGANADIRKYKEIDSLHPAVAYFINGNIKSNLWDFDAAIVDFDKAIEIDSDYAKAYDARGKTRTDALDPSSARSEYSSLADFNKAISLDSTDAEMYYHRAMHYMNNQNFTLAIPDCNRAISLNPQYASAYLIRGFAYFGSGQKLVSACEDINKAIALGARIDPNELQGIQQVCK